MPCQRMKQPDVDDILIGFAKSLRRLRRARKLSQQELALRAGRSMQYISLLESSKYQPTLETIALLSHALDMSLTELVKEVEDEVREGV